MPMTSGDVRSSSGDEELVAQVTNHATDRMSERGIPPEAVDKVLEYGREVPTRGGTVYAIGRQEVKRYAREGVDLVEYSGVQVVCTGHGVVLTVYRNHNFRQLRVGLGRGRYNRVARSRIKKW
jgi:hypothetical protein